MIIAAMCFITTNVYVQKTSVLNALLTMTITSDVENSKN